MINALEPLFSQHENFSISFVMEMGLKSDVQGLHPRQFENGLVMSNSAEVAEESAKGKAISVGTEKGDW